MITGIDPSYFNQLNLTEPFSFRFFANSNELNGNTFNVEYQAKASYLSLSMPSYRMVITCEINHGLCSLNIGTKVYIELSIDSRSESAELSSLYVESIKPSKDGLKADVVLVDEWHLLDGNSLLRNCHLYSQDDDYNFSFNYNANDFITAYKVKTLKTISASLNNDVVWLPPKITINEALQRVSFANGRTICYKNSEANYDNLTLFGSNVIFFKNINFLDFQVIDKADTNFTTNLSVKKFDYSGTDKPISSIYAYISLEHRVPSSQGDVEHCDNSTSFEIGNGFYNLEMCDWTQRGGTQNNFKRTMEVYNDHIELFSRNDGSAYYYYETYLTGQNVVLDTTSQYTYYEPNISDSTTANVIKGLLRSYFSYPSISIDKCRINPCIECMDSVITDDNRIIVEEISWSYNGSFVGSLKGRLLPILLPPVLNNVSRSGNTFTLVAINGNGCQAYLEIEDSEGIAYVERSMTSGESATITFTATNLNHKIYAYFDNDDNDENLLSSKVLVFDPDE